MKKSKILAFGAIVVSSTIANANDIFKSNAEYLSAINNVKIAASYCNTMPVQESKEAYVCYESQRTQLKNMTVRLDSSNKTLGILDYSKPYINKSYLACENTYPSELRTFFKAQISQCKLGADVTLAVYAINSINYS